MPRYPSLNGRSPRLNPNCPLAGGSTLTDRVTAALAYNDQLADALRAAAEKAAAVQDNMAITLQLLATAPRPQAAQLRATAARTRKHVADTRKIIERHECKASE
jgi:hypothetical protein